MFLVIGGKRLAAAACCAALALAVFGIGAVAGLKTFGSRAQDVHTVLVDAGHGLPDGGATGVNGTIEANINLEIANRLCEVLNGKGIKTDMTRTTEDGIRNTKNGKWSKKEDMNSRMQMIKKSDADLFVSIHMNHFPQSGVHGLRLFYSQSHPEVKELAEQMQQRMSELTGAKVSAVRAADSGLFLMRSHATPALLVECGFLSNPEEEKNLNSEEYQARLAWAIAETIEAYFSPEG